MGTERGSETRETTHEPENRRLADQRLTQIRFMVAMRPKKRVQTTHEPQRRAGVPPAPAAKPSADLYHPARAARSRGRRDACPTLGCPRFMVAMRAKNDVEAAHEPDGSGA